METLLLYFGKVILTSAILFIYYGLFLKDRTFHHYNRFYLISVLFLSVLLPLIKVSYFTLEVNSDMLLLIKTLQFADSSNKLSSFLITFQLLYFLIGLGASFFLIKLIAGIIKIQSFKKNFPRQRFEGIDFYDTDLPEAPFSFFKNLFWKSSICINSDLGRQILKHEMVHIEQKHSWDKIFTETVTALFWFNPFFYFIKKELYLIHEYLADKKALQQSDTKAFAQMLFASHFSGRQFPVTSPFLSSNLKKRLKMLKKSKTKFSYARKILALPIVFTLSFIYVVNAKNKEIMQTNNEIEHLIDSRKKDTIVEKSNKVEAELASIEEKIAQKNLEIKPLQDQYSNRSLEAQKLTQQMQLKSAQLQKLSEKKFDSPEYKKLNQELDQLSGQLVDVFNTQEFKKAEKLFDVNYQELDQLYAQLDKVYNSEAFKQKMKDAERQMQASEKMFNSPEYKLKIKEAEEKIKQADKMFNSPEFKLKIKEAEAKMKAAEKKFDSPEFKLKMREYEDKVNSPAFQKKMEDMETKINTPEFKATIKNSISSAKEAIKAAAAAPEASPSGIKVAEQADIYIDGLKSSKSAMENLSPDRIESMYIYKKGNQGKEQNEIHVKTKK